MTMPSYVINWEDLGDSIDLAGKYKVIEGIRDLQGYQKVEGYALHVPLVGGEYYVVNKKISKKIALTNITYAQSCYNYKDYWELWVNGDRLFETIYTKEFGENKHWEMVHYLESGDILSLVHHNNSHTSKDIWVDLEYIDIEEALHNE